MNTAMNQENPMQLIFMLLAFGLIFYFMVIRPQSKKQQEHKKMIESLTKGTEVLTNGGIIGSIIKIKDQNDYAIISLNSGTELTIKKDYITAILPKGSMQSILK